jgi:hypothetical protein
MQGSKLNGVGFCCSINLDFIQQGVVIAQGVGYAQLAHGADQQAVGLLCISGAQNGDTVATRSRFQPVKIPGQVCENPVPGLDGTLFEDVGVWYARPGPVAGRCGKTAQPMQGVTRTLISNHGESNLPTLYRICPERHV